MDGNEFLKYKSGSSLGIKRLGDPLLLAINWHTKNGSVELR